MIPVDADRIVGARILHTARRLTQISDTGFHQRTLIVRGALNWLQRRALDRRITLVAGRARANWSVHFRVARRRRCADSVKVTRILAKLHIAYLGLDTVRVRLAGLGYLGRARWSFDACTGYRVAWNAWWTVFAAGRHLGRCVLLDAVAAIAYRSRSTVG